MVIGSFVGYMALGWYFTGLGSVLPELEGQIGGISALYPLLPGVVLFTWGIVLARRQHRSRRAARLGLAVTVAGLALPLSIAVMGITIWTAVSVVGGVGAAVAAAALVRLLPASIATERPDDTERAMVLANAWSSLSSITAPLFIGLTIGIGAGWLPGMLGPIALAGVITTICARSARRPSVAVASVENSHSPVPPFRHWGRAWAILTTGIVLEFCFSYYVTTFLFDEVGMSSAAAAAGTAAWGGGMTLGRFALSTWSLPAPYWSTFGLVMVGFLLLWGVATPVTSLIGIGIAGVRVAPLYPTRMAALMERFPGSPDQAATRGSIASGTALLLAPALMASIRVLADVRTAYLVVPVLLTVLAVLHRRPRST